MSEGTFEGKLKNVKKKDQRAAKLSEKDLDNVSGGYWEDSGYAAGFFVACPNCGESRKGHINTWIESDPEKLDGFQCLSCGNTFAINAYGDVWSEM